MDSSPQISLLQTAWLWWVNAAGYEGRLAATRRLLAVLWEFVRDSTPERRRSRFGDADYDWEYRVNTTSGAVGWRDRLLGMFHSEYQPTDPVAFREMLDGLQQTIAQSSNSDQGPLNLRNFTLSDFTFVDLGSGKGRTLLMASDYPFRRIVGVELIPALHQIAQENVRQYKSELQKCFVLETICADATTFLFPEEPLVVFLFNPFGESGMRQVVANIEQSLTAHPRRVYVLYHNPLLEHILAESGALKKIAGMEQYSVFCSKLLAASVVRRK
jgi:predicted RNA methylase